MTNHMCLPHTEAFALPRLVRHTHVVYGPNERHTTGTCVRVPWPRLEQDKALGVHVAAYDAGHVSLIAL